MTKLLLIEDNPDHYLLVRRILEKQGQDYEITYVKSADEGVSRILSQEFDAVLCDYRLDGVTALDVLRRLKKQGVDIPFIVATSSGSEHAAVELMKEGAYDYINKETAYDASLDVVIRSAREKFTIRRAKQLAERALKISEEKYRSLVEHLPAITYLALINDDSTSIYVSPQITSLLGYAPEEVIGDPQFWSKHVHPDDKERVYALLKEAHRTFSAFSVEYRFFSRDGRIRWFQDNASVMHDSQDGAFYMHGVMFDITDQKRVQEELQKINGELKRAQEELIQSGKMAAVGQLATGISHELNQPLTGIKGFAQAALLAVGESNPLREDLTRIVEQSDRMDKIIKNVRFFARKSEFSLKELDVHAPIEDSFMLVNEQLKLHNIKVEKQFAAGLPAVYADANQLQQAFINLITNARDAIDATRLGAGTISVVTRACRESGQVEIVFTDTGCGIASANIGSIFNPFFTTKSPNGGMGLGLAIVYRIIENHRGAIRAESEEGKGAVFTITLPAACLSGEASRESAPGGGCSV